MGSTYRPEVAWPKGEWARHVIPPAGSLAASSPELPAAGRGFAANLEKLRLFPSTFPILHLTPTQ